MEYKRNSNNPKSKAPSKLPSTTARIATVLRDELPSSITLSWPTLIAVTPNLSSSPDVAAVFRRDTISLGLVCAPLTRRKANSTMTLPSVTDTMIICVSAIFRIAAKPETNAIRRSDPSPNVWIDPVSLIMICACSSAWQDELPAGAENPDVQGKQTEDPVTALNVPGKHGVHDSLLAPSIE